jgi:hypothetical protein
MLKQRSETTVKPERDEGIRHLYWAPKDIHETRERLKSPEYGVSEREGIWSFFLLTTMISISLASGYRRGDSDRDNNATAGSTPGVTHLV